jgi:acyl-CoA thioesterase FadM
VVCVNADSFIPTGIPADIIDKLNQ